MINLEKNSVKLLFTFSFFFSFLPFNQWPSFCDIIIDAVRICWRLFFRQIFRKANKLYVKVDSNVSYCSIVYVCLCIIPCKISLKNKHTVLQSLPIFQGTYYYEQTWISFLPSISKIAVHFQVNVRLNMFLSLRTLYYRNFRQYEDGGVIRSALRTKF